MRLYMGYGSELHIDCHEDITKAQQDVFFKLDDLDEISLFTVTKTQTASGSTEYSYTSIFKEYGGLVLQKKANGYVEFWLEYKLADVKHITAKERAFYMKPHTFSFRINDKTYNYENLYIQPRELQYEFIFQKMEITAQNEATLYLLSNYDIGDVGFKGKGKDNAGYEITSKRVDGMDYHYKLKIQPPTTSTEAYVLFFNFDVSKTKRLNQYWRAAGSYTNYYIYIYDLGLPKMFIKAKGKIFRAVDYKREEKDRVMYILANETIMNDARVFIKTKFGITEVEMKRFYV